MISKSFTNLELKVWESISLLRSVTRTNLTSFGLIMELITRCALAKSFEDSKSFNETRKRTQRERS